jgi:hypothetical protein
MLFQPLVDGFGDVIVVVHQVIFDNQINNIGLGFNGLETR